MLRTLRRSLGGILLVLATAAFIGMVLHGFIAYPWLDMPVHFSGGCATAHAAWVGAEEAEPSLGRIALPVRAVLCVGVTAIAAVSWEFLEFISDVSLHTHLNLGVRDTLSDLLFGLLGGCAMAAIHCQLTRRDPAN